MLTGRLQHKIQKKEREIYPILKKIYLPNVFYDLQAPQIFIYSKAVIGRTIPLKNHIKGDQLKNTAFPWTAISLGVASDQGSFTLAVMQN